MRRFAQHHHRLLRAGLTALQFVAARVANRRRRTPRRCAEHTVSDLLVAHRMSRRIRDGDRVLDVGCGSGHWLRRMRLFRDVDAVGVDLACPSGERDGTCIMTYDGRTLPFSDKSFDVVLFCYVLHHLSPAHARCLMAEAARVGRRCIFILEDSMPRFGWWYRLRNACHRMETQLEYASASSIYELPEREAMFLTHAGWSDWLGATNGIERVELVSLDDLHRYAHHTMVVASL